MSAAPAPTTDQDAEAVARVPVVFISNDGYALPTAIALHSLIESRRSTTTYIVYIVASDMSDEYVCLLDGLATDGVEVQIVRQHSSIVQDLHTVDPSAIAAATVDALLKLFLPSILPNESKVLYLDGDILIRDDLAELYATGLDGCYIAATPDSGAIYYKHDYVDRVSRYFNSGVMLIDLDAWRRDGVTERLVARKRELSDSNLVDQNVLNVELDGNVAYLPPRYNVLWVNLLRAAGKGAVTIQEFNHDFGTAYASFDDLLHDAAIVHFSSKDKPWKYSDTPYADEWYRQFLDARLPYTIDRATSELTSSGAEDPSPRVSVIVPFYQAESYLRDSVCSALCQDLAEIEVICVDDGSNDRGSEIIEELTQCDPRVRLLSQENRGAGAARNVALQVARGEFVLFLDSDDWLAPGSLLDLYLQARDGQLDVLMFEGVAFYETAELEARHSEYKSYYRYKQDYDSILSGSALFVAATHAWDMKDSAALRLIRREFLAEQDILFPEGIVREDCYFAFATLVSAARAAIVRRSAYVRRVRAGSVMTGADAEAHYRGLMTVVNLMLERLSTLSVADVVIDAAAVRIGSYLKQAQKYLAAIPVEQAEVLESRYHLTVANAVILAKRVQFFSPAHRVLAKCRAENQELRRRLSVARAELASVRERRRQVATGRDRALKEVSALKRSTSYRLGHALTQPVRIIRSLVSTRGRVDSGSPPNLTPQ